MKNERLVICIASPDSYSDVFQVFYDCFMKFCLDCPYELILSTNTGKYDHITVLDNYKSNDSWTERMLDALHLVTEKYVLLMCDDTIVTAPVDYDEVERVLDDMDSYKLNFCGLLNKLKGEPLYKGSILFRIKNSKAYGKNLQCGIYNREYLLKEIGDGGLSAWDLEAKWLSEAAAANQDYSSDVVSCGKNIFHCVHGISKGKWFESAIEKIQEVGIPVETDREIISKNRERIMVLSGKVGKMLSPQMRKKIKKYLSKLGYKFVTSD